MQVCHMTPAETSLERHTPVEPMATAPVFEIAAGTSSIATIASFNGVDGANPYGGVTLDTNGNLFGTTSAGGTANVGAVFEIVAGTSAIITVASFNVADGANPYAGVTLDSSGNLFGTANQGGTGDEGIVYEILHGAGAIRAPASFNSVNGAYPYGSVTLDASGNLFGTDQGDDYGFLGLGSVFEIICGTSTINTILPFASLGFFGWRGSLRRPDR